MRRIRSLNKRKDFSRLSKEGASWVTSSFIVQLARNTEEEPRLGFTVSRKIGKAVVRNRVKRRLRQIAWKNFSNLKTWSVDYVVIARPACVQQEFRILEKEFKWALKHGQRLLKEACSDSVSP